MQKLVPKFWLLSFLRFLPGMIICIYKYLCILCVFACVWIGRQNIAVDAKRKVIIVGRAAAAQGRGGDWEQRRGGRGSHYSSIENCQPIVTFRFKSQECHLIIGTTQNYTFSFSLKEQYHVQKNRQSVEVTLFPKTFYMNESIIFMILLHSFV